MPYYAVKKGVKTGIWESWADIKPLVSGFFGAKFRKFDNLEDARVFLGDVAKNSEIRASDHRTPQQDGDSSLANPEADNECKNGVGEDECYQKENEIVIFCDGACSGNGKANAKAGYAVVLPFYEELNGAWALSGEPRTNNRAELMGIIKSFEVAAIIDHSCKKTVIIYTDSMLIVNSVSTWIKKWQKSNWKKSDGTDVLNQDLLKRIIEFQKVRKSEIRHVRAHTGRTDFWSVNNDKVDKLARSSIC